MSFEQQLEVGLLGESRISRWLLSRGNLVLPAYEVELSHWKGPRLFTGEGSIISPDLLVFNSKCTKWIEAKSKSAFTWHRATGSWQTGIDRRHWREYLRVAKLTPFEVWILFLHSPNGMAKDTPEELMSPSGLFGNSIEILNSKVDHEHENHGPSGMVYWRVESLRKLADYNSIPV